MRESSTTLHGQLQRGLGRAARRAAASRGAGEYVYDCVRRDPRWDAQCEERGLYYARLIVDLELPAGPLADHLFDPADAAGSDADRGWLTLCVLGDLVRLSRRESAAILRRYAEDGTHWSDALEILADLGDPSLTAGLDGLVAARCDEDDLFWLLRDPDNPVFASWAARQPRIAAALSRNRDRTLVPRPAPGPAGLSLLPEDVLHAMASGRGDDAMPAIFELGRRRSPALLDLAEEFAPLRPSRWGGAVARALRGCGPRTVPRARIWAASPGSAHGLDALGLDILARHGTRQDIPLLMTALDTALTGRAWGSAASPIEGLGRLRAGESVPLLKSAWTESEYSYLRPRVLTALARTAPHTAEAFTTEGLWDAEEAVREIAAQTAPRTPDTTTRLRRLHHDAAEDPGIRATAAARLL